MSEKQQISSVAVEPHLIVYPDRSVLIDTKGDEQIFREGRLSSTAQARLEEIREALASGFLEKIIDDCKKLRVDFEDLSSDQFGLLERLVNSITSEVGRALVGLTVMQLCIKSISPEQSVRLHKGSRNYGQIGFSWIEGISMRSLDRAHITPVLRQYGLLHLNADGFMMTRAC